MAGDEEKGKILSSVVLKRGSSEDIVVVVVVVTVVFVSLFEYLSGEVRFIKRHLAIA